MARGAAASGVITGSLLKTAESTSPTESMVEIVRPRGPRVKNCRHGEIALRWTAARMPPPHEEAPLRTSARMSALLT
jgi:hypothetical protein